MKGDLKTFGKDTSIYAVGNLLNRIGVLILLPLYTTYLSTAQYGMLELFYSTSSVVTSCLGFGLGHATLRFYFEYDFEIDRKSVIGTSLISSFIISFFGVAFLTLWNKPLSQLLFGSAEYAELFYLLYAILVFEMSTKICFAYTRAKGYALFFVYVNLIRLFVQVTFNYYAIVILHKDLGGILAGNLLAVFTSWLLVFFITVRDNGLRFDWSKLKSILSYSYPFYGSSLVSVIFKNADRYLINSMIGLSAVGVYSLALRFAQLPAELFGEPFKRSFGAFRFAIMKQRNAEEMQIRITNYMVYGYMFLSLGFAFYSIDVLRIMSDSEFWAAVKYLPILLLAGCISSLSYPFQTSIMITKKTKYVFYISLAVGTTVILSNVLLIPIMDVYGACLAAVLGAMVSSFFTLFVSQKLQYIHYNFRTINLTFINAFVLYGMFMLLPDGNWIISVVLKTILLFLFVVMQYITGCLTASELAKVKELIGRKITTVHT